MYNYQKSWGQDIIDAVWNKAFIVQGWNPNIYRLDMCGAIIQRDQYANTNSESGYGWEIDHIKPISRGGDDTIINLRPLQWTNNRVKGDSTDGYWKPLIKAVQCGDGSLKNAK